MVRRASLLNVFGRSPIRPLQEHIAKAHSCVETLLPFFQAVLREDWAAAEEHQIQIKTFENEADRLKRDLRLHLPKGLFLPVSRTDILELLTMQDCVANKAEDIAGLMLGRKMQIPQAIAKELTQFLQRSIDAATQAQKAINELDELLETGFRGNEVNVVEEMIRELDKIEHVTDEMQVKIRRGVFEIERELPAINAMFLYTIIEWIGDLADHSQQVGNRLQLLLAH